MKSQKGFTLVAVTVYIIVIALVIGIIATVTSFFYSNTKYIDESGQNAAQFDTFNMFFLEDVKKEENSIVGLKSDNNSAVTTKRIEFSDGTVYTIKDNGIYRNKVKICSNVNSSSGFKCEMKDNKILVTANLTFGDTFAKNVEYLASGKIQGYHTFEISNAQNANPPDVSKNMTPVIYYNGSWYTTTADDPSWYDYTKGQNKWANAVIGEYEAGMDLGNGENYSFYVWIPRFEYNPDSISINFVKGVEQSIYIHPAFSKVYNPTIDNAQVEAQEVELEGFWISKFRAIENFGFCNIEEEPKKVNLEEFFTWFLEQLNSNPDTQNIIASMIADYRIFHMQTNTDYGAITYLTLCALDGIIPEAQTETVREMNENYSTTGNMTGIFEMNIIEGQLVDALYATTDFPCQDPEYYNGGSLSSYFYVARIADNTSNTISTMAYDRYLGTGLNLDNSYESIENYNEVYLRDETMTGAKIVPIDSSSTFHMVIMKRNE